MLFKSHLEFGKAFVEDGSQIPQIEIKVMLDLPNGDKYHVSTRYLSAFRDYAFQVSGNRHGETDLGSTPVFGLDTFGHILQAGTSNLGIQEAQLYIMSCTAFDAIRKFTNHNNSAKYFIECAFADFIGEGSFKKGSRWEEIDLSKVGQLLFGHLKDDYIEELKNAEESPFEVLCELPKNEPLINIVFDSRPDQKSWREFLFMCYNRYCKHRDATLTPDQIAYLENNDDYKNNFRNGNYEAHYN
jgi:hypothetical protein